jgi:hypothetical protein
MTKTDHIIGFQGKSAKFLSENWRKSPKNVVISLAPPGLLLIFATDRSFRDSGTGLPDFRAQHTKTVENLPNFRKIYQNIYEV